MKKKHKHKFLPSPEILGWLCSCGNSQFGTRFGLAEYSLKDQQTIHVSDGKILWEQKKPATNVTS